MLGGSTWLHTTLKGSRMHQFTKCAAVGAVVIALALVLATLGARSAYADDLPYKAYGSGLKPGATVEALKGGTSVGKATVAAAGTWSLDIPATKAANGDIITFMIDGKAANESITFQSGQFPAPPGLTLTLAGSNAGPTGTFDRGIPYIGVNPAVWNGGTVKQLTDATVLAGGISVYVYVGGQAVVLIPGAPDFVNAAFNAAFPSGVPAGTIVLVTK